MPTTSTASLQKALNFLQGGGVMGELTRDFDWSQTPLGAPNTWPQSLRVIVSTLLNSRFPMLLYWGAELIQLYNDAFQVSLGNKHPKALGQRCQDCWPEMWDAVGTPINGVMRTGIATWNEDQLLPIMRNGILEDAYWTYSFTPVLGETEGVEGVLVVCTETTENVHLVRQLSDSRAELQFAIDATELGTWDLNPVTGTLKSNARLKEWFGLGPDDEVPFSHAVAVMAEDDRQRVTDAIQAALQYDSGGKYTSEYTIVNPQTRERRLVCAKGRAWFGEDRIAYRFNGTLQDITSQKAGEAEIKESEARFQNLIREATVGIIVLMGEDMEVAIVNKAYGKLIALSPEALLGKRLFDLIPDAAAQFRPLLNNVRITGEALHLYGEPYSVTMHGNKIEGYLNIVYQPYKEADGTITGVMALCQDATPQILAARKIEDVVAARTQELAEANIRLAQSNEGLAEANTLLAHSNDELAQYAYVASHDLQEPLRKIRTFTSMLTNGQGSVVEDSTLLSKISHSAERMSSLIEGLLHFSRLLKSDSGFVETDLNEIAATVVNDYELVVAEKGASVKAGNLPVIDASPMQMNQLFYNLLGNALKFTQPDRTPLITIQSTLSTAEDVATHIRKPSPDILYYDIAIEDNGIGFETQYSEQIFEVFKRLHTRDIYPGSGIGLALCRRIVANHGGALHAESVPGKATTFHVVLPARQSEG